MNDVLTLLWKEYRNNTHLIILGLAMLFLPVFIVMSFSFGDRPVSEAIATGLTFGAIGGLILSQLLLLCLGGHLVAGERSTRSFEFLFNQPVSRGKIVLAKLIFVVLWTAIVWALAVLMISIGFQTSQPESGLSTNVWLDETFAEIAATGAMFFGSSWLASNKVEGSVLAIGIGVVITGGTFLFLQFIKARFDSLLTIGDYDWTRIVAFFLLSSVSTAIGVRIFVRRKSP